VFSPGTVLGDDAHTYVLRGVPDGAEDFGDFVAAKRTAEDALLGREIRADESVLRELPELPGFEIEPLNTEGVSIVPALSARIAGALVGHPMP
jgi:hypothetical protein